MLLLQILIKNTRQEASSPRNSNENSESLLNKSYLRLLLNFHQIQFQQRLLPTTIRLSLFLRCYWCYVRKTTRTNHFPRISSYLTLCIHWNAHKSIIHSCSYLNLFCHIRPIFDYYSRICRYLTVELENLLLWAKSNSISLGMNLSKPTFLSKIIQQNHPSYIWEEDDGKTVVQRPRITIILVSQSLALWLMSDHVTNMF